MTIYFRPDSVPELAGLSSWEQRVLLRGTFLRERAISTVVLLLAVLGSVQFAINPLLERFAPTIRTDSVIYAVILVIWLLLLMKGRDIVLMNMLRPKFAVKRAEQKAAEIAKLEAERAAENESKAAE
ncbi:hypothetical protein HQ393_09155 [Chitinibacter bivalviorum]|uniref:Uncharacterized protein n=1 Tax=Chitinibacter bivalviorum TaxID=2739434 RepID=A0A7H9BK50_9NEIS|nr:hypothetical protein [Chitinibacter bivalviorum]QLG88401.1 hypothetical protein HQ393_09155 [Chitinibacter bivalviorum]